MSYAIVRVQKMSAGSVQGIQIHDRRESGVSHTNPDIDRTRSCENYDLHSQSKTFHSAVNARIDSLKLKKAVRKDAVVLAQALVTSNQSFFESLSPEQCRDFFVDSYQFLSSRYGQENVISATIHMDERTPHMHFNFVPVTPDGRLSAKDVLTRAALIDQQDAFRDAVGVKYGLLRGETWEEGKKHGKRRQHLEGIEYKVLTSKIAEKAENLQNDIEVLEKEKNRLERKIRAFSVQYKTLVEYASLSPDDVAEWIRNQQKDFLVGIHGRGFPESLIEDQVERFTRPYTKLYRSLFGSRGDSPAPDQIRAEAIKAFVESKGIAPPQKKARRSDEIER